MVLFFSTVSFSKVYFFTSLNSRIFISLVSPQPLRPPSPSMVPWTIAGIHRRGPKTGKLQCMENGKAKEITDQRNHDPKQLDKF